MAKCICGEVMDKSSHSTCPYSTLRPQEAVGDRLTRAESPNNSCLQQRLMYYYWCMWTVRSQTRVFGLQKTFSYKREILKPFKMSTDRLLLPFAGSRQGHGIMATGLRTFLRGMSHDAVYTWGSYLYWHWNDGQGTSVRASPVVGNRANAWLA